MQMMHRVWKPRMHLEIGDGQLTIAQLGILFCIKTSGSTTGKQLAADMSISKGAVAQMLEALDQTGLIVREQDPEDRRIVHVSLSEAGKAKAKAMSERRKAVFKKMASVLTEDELRTMVEIQQKMVERLQALPQEEIAKE
jgi:DNA-binding MarR family transcriptional regulator